jgi:hypothetical protein
MHRYSTVAVNNLTMHTKSKTITYIDGMKELLGRQRPPRESLSDNAYEFDQLMRFMSSWMRTTTWNDVLLRASPLSPLQSLVRITSIQRLPPLHREL